MDKNFSKTTLREPLDFYRRNSFITTTMMVNGAEYQVIMVNPMADAPTINDTIKYLIKGQ